jgi:hypothetical protein
MARGKMQYIESPERVNLKTKTYSVFLAGGITGCPDWQQEMRQLLRETDLLLLNPRRADFPIHDPTAAPKQIQWEFDCLRLSDSILFWFPKETLCPIVLYELGAWSMTRKQIFIGVHPEYQRRQDVEIQTGFARPEISIVYSLVNLAAIVIDSMTTERPNHENTNQHL